MQENSNSSIHLIFTFLSDEPSLFLVSDFQESDDYNDFIKAKNAFINDIKGDCKNPCENCDFLNAELPCKEEDYEVLFIKKGKFATCSSEIADLFSIFAKLDYKNIRVAS